MEKKVLIILAIVVVLSAVGIVALYLRDRTDDRQVITSFEECAAAGFAIMESYPRQCRTDDGELFVEEIDDANLPIDDGSDDVNDICVDMCGDGICQEVVCMGSGCPCPETPESCPEDCAVEENGGTGLANPASQYCIEQGGELEIRDEVEGQVGYCIFEDGNECEEWAFFNGECAR